MKTTFSLGRGNLRVKKVHMRTPRNLRWTMSPPSSSQFCLGKETPKMGILPPLLHQRFSNKIRHLRHRHHRGLHRTLHRHRQTRPRSTSALWSGFWRSLWSCSWQQSWSCWGNTIHIFHCKKIISSYVTFEPSFPNFSNVNLGKIQLVLIKKGHYFQLPQEE